MCEPRGSEVVVGALLVEPRERTSSAAVIFFDDVAYLGMCGRGTISLQRAKERHGITDISLSPAVRKCLTAYRWPGDVRQIENVLERLLVLPHGNIITEVDLPEELPQPPTSLRPIGRATRRRN